jgi:hypothetical protein
MTPSAIVAGAIEKTEKVEPKVPTAASVLSVESETGSAELDAPLTRIKNAPVAPSPGALLGEPLVKQTEAQASQTITNNFNSQAGIEPVSQTITNNFNTQASIEPVSGDQTTANLILLEQLKKLEEMKSIYFEEQKLVKSTESARSIAASPSTALAEINKSFDITESAKGMPAEETAGLKTRFAGINATILKGAASLGQLMSGLISPMPKAGEAQAGEASTVRKLPDYVQGALGKGLSPVEVTGFVAEPEKPEPVSRVRQTSLNTTMPEAGKAQLQFIPEGMAGKILSEAGADQAELAYLGEISAQEILNRAGEESPDIFKMGNFESTLKIEPQMLESPATSSGSANVSESTEYSSSVKNEQANIKVKSSNPISNRSLVNNIINPPNPVVAEVKGLNNTISNTSEKMNSSIEKISTASVKEAAAQLTQGAQTLTTNNSTVNQMNGMQEAVEKREQSQSSQGSMGDGLSSYYLQAIYDALVVQGIKIRSI